MRELKFRAWSKTLCKYVDKGFALIDGYGDTYDSPCVGTVEHDDDYIIEQYTGLKDKKGKEIYEGDVLREKGLLSLTCVEWDKNNARYITKILDKSKCVSSYFYFDIITALECEVVGNIHENPELLEGECES